MSPLAVAVQAIPVFVATNLDDLVVATLYLGRARGHRAAEWRVVAGQYLGYAAILAISVLAASGLRLLPTSALPYLGLVPIALGVRAGFLTWRRGPDDGNGEGGIEQRPAGVGQVAGVAFANGGDSVGVYVPVLAGAGVGTRSIYLLTFLVLLAGWLVLARHLAGRPAIARTLDRWGHVALPVVLVAIGVVILVEGGAFRS